MFSTASRLSSSRLWVEERTWREPEVGGLYPWTASHEHGALNRVIELPHVARPAVMEHGLQRTGLEAGHRLR